MQKKQKFLMLLFTVTLFVLAACGNSTDKSSAKPNKQSSIQTADDSKGDSLEKSASVGVDTTNQNDQENASNNPSTNSNDRGSQKATNLGGKTSESMKDDYLKKLNEMEESDKNVEAKTIMAEMEEQEAERYKAWDEELNKIYSVLREQLSTEQMEQVRIEQQNWIEYRDESAKKASLKYKGGSTESLEYVATQASLTRERCYELVAKYMK
ncbi:DUF1311 domain-containing protein [Neobacillus notoginsengisoli]|uniref:DUF1311 domain-containing protein n=1 Tax=Neobacillus notoginsengisoli TaxID=1578198 RepID=A0A417Z043_9BACI|nr:lysozyme inhibitor LprI family protein [Neobacillus notoginsengisoli]RHW43396.1 DUF1311 domain-containing protein [Neobacillus notoginsengisoli]